MRKREQAFSDSPATLHGTVVILTTTGSFHLIPTGLLRWLFEPREVFSKGGNTVSKSRHPSQPTKHTHSRSQALIQSPATDAVPQGTASYRALERRQRLGRKIQPGFCQALMAQEESWLWFYMCWETTGGCQAKELFYLDLLLKEHLML